MLKSTGVAIERTSNAMVAHDHGDISFIPAYCYTHFAKHECQAEPMFVVTIHDDHTGQSHDTYSVLGSAWTYDSASTAITFDPALARTSSGGMSATPSLDFDATIYGDTCTKDGIIILVMVSEFECIHLCYTTIC
jgi:hypothetical protein